MILDNCTIGERVKEETSRIEGINIRHLRENERERDREKSPSASTSLIESSKHENYQTKLANRSNLRNRTTRRIDMKILENRMETVKVPHRDNVKFRVQESHDLRRNQFPRKPLVRKLLLRVMDQLCHQHSLKNRTPRRDPCLKKSSVLQALNRDDPSLALLFQTAF